MPLPAPHRPAWARAAAWRQRLARALMAASVAVSVAASMATAWAPAGAAGAAPVPALQGTPQAQALLRDFPLLARLLLADDPWGQTPQDLARAIASRPPPLAQGSEAHPLLLADRREPAGWPGEPLFGLHAYESEYYFFDRERPLLRLHIGRPLVFALQHGRPEARAAARAQGAQFPVLQPQEVQQLLARLNALAEALAPFGARREPCASVLVACYRLPNGVHMRVTDFSGSTNGTPYVEIALGPPSPLHRFAGTQTLAFPGAEGAGRYAQGGRGGRVFVVTTLADYLPRGRPGRPAGTYGQPSAHALSLGEGRWVPHVDALGRPEPGVGRPLLPAFGALPAEPVIAGSLREAVEARGPRTIVFAVSGTIELLDELVVREPYLTIAGQSAPGDGVQLRNFGLVIDTHDVIVRHLRIRVGEIKGPGDTPRTLGEQTHGLDVSGLNVIVDHCDIAYANDQLFNIYGTERREAVTLQWSYLYGGPSRSTHEKGDHSMASVGVGWGFASLHHNLFAHTRTRNPRVDMLSYDFRNNVIYNFGAAGYGSPNDNLRLNYVGNTLLRGPDTRRQDLHAFGDGSFTTPYGQWYGEGNRLPAGFAGLFDAPARSIVARPHGLAPVTTHSAEEALSLVLAQGGASKPVRDSVTRYVAATVAERSGFIPRTPADWPGGGYARYRPARAPADLDGNGLPDAWERARGLEPGTVRANGRDLDPRYDNIEVYLNGL